VVSVALEYDVAFVGGAVGRFALALADRFAFTFPDGFAFTFPDDNGFAFAFAKDSSVDDDASVLSCRRACLRLVEQGADDEFAARSLDGGDDQQHEQ
jgi:hypothetical protein